MKTFFINKLDWVLGAGVVLFLVSYILFLSLATSLDFKIEILAEKKTVLEEEREELLAQVVMFQSREALAVAGADLDLVEATLANGYVDIRPVAVSAAESLAKKP